MKVFGVIDNLFHTVSEKSKSPMYIRILDVNLWPSNFIY